jgi:hypothetical protein
VLRPDDSFAIGPVYTSNTFYIHDHSLATNKTFRWKVKAYDKSDSSGYYSDSIRQMYFTILGKPYSGESPVFRVVENLPSEIVNICISPNSIAPGDNLSISWNYGEQQSFELVLFRNSDLSNPYAQIIKETSGANRFSRCYTWSIPDDFMPGDYRILVRGTGNNGIVKEKFSDVFTIRSIIELSHVILEPDPASVGQTVTVRWTSRGQAKFELKICKHRSLWFDQTEVVKEGTTERSHTFRLPGDWGDGTYYAEVKVWNHRGDEKKMQSDRIHVR